MRPWRGLFCRHGLSTVTYYTRGLRRGVTPAFSWAKYPPSARTGLPGTGTRVDPFAGIANVLPVVFRAILVVDAPMDPSSGAALPGAGARSGPVASVCVLRVLRDDAMALLQLQVFHQPASMPVITLVDRALMGPVDAAAEDAQNLSVAWPCHCDLDFESLPM